MRLFVSVDLPADLADAVAAVQDEFRDAPGLRFVDPTQAHVTLKFLGEVPERRVSRVSETLGRAVQTAGVAPFELELSGVGAFPSHDYISVVWLGVAAGTSELTALHDAIEAAFVDAGFEPEDHAFTPHVTLARMEHAGGKAHVQDVLERYDPEPGGMRVSEVRLTRSDLEADGPHYSTVHRVPLE